MARISPDFKRKLDTFIDSHTNADSSDSDVVNVIIKAVEKHGCIQFSGIVIRDLLRERGIIE
jgi:hypothetical protein